MNEKQSILQLMMPKAVLKALTPEARDSIPHNLLEQDMVRISQFPFKVGRESRIKEIDGKLVRVERPKRDDSEPNNDLYLIDAGQPLHISREHFQIEKNSTGYILIDRGSACGVTVGTSKIGGRDSGGEARLNDGDIIAVGATDTPYLFKFITLESPS
jgi:hypothetical protein